MSIKATTRYMLRDILISVAWFYGIYAAICILGVSITTLSFNGSTGTITDTEAAAALFLFIYGLNSFKAYFGMLMQNGVSRKTMFVGRLFTFALVSLLMTLVSSLLAAVLSALSSSNLTITTSLYTAIYGDGLPMSLFLAPLFNFGLYLMMLTLGYCITTLFYRLNPTGKVAVGAGVPVLLTIVLPTLDSQLFGGRISMAVVRFFAFAFGLNWETGHRPWMAVISFWVAACLFALFGWLLTRRATVRR